MRNERILISGASIAGLTLADWLARHGFRPAVVERVPQLRVGGNGVDVRGQAVDVVERMGIMPRVRAAATDVHGMKFIGADNSIARIDTRDAGAVEIMRGDLVTLPHESTDTGVEYTDRTHQPVPARALPSRLASTAAQDQAPLRLGVTVHAPADRRGRCTLRGLGGSKAREDACAPMLDTGAHGRTDEESPK
jgi:2-polyprenyl-6-methoxyphenol hydroxylase-like FAD-dependent oxidoreductase